MEHELTDELLFAEIDPTATFEEARMYLKHAPADECEKRVMLKAEPPFLFLMSDTTYLEFSLFDLLQIVEPDDGDELQSRMFGVEFMLEGQNVFLWMAAKDAEAKHAWVLALEGMAKTVTGSSKSFLDTTELGVSWEIDFKELTFGRCLGAGAFGTVHAGVLWGTSVAVKRLKTVTTQSLASLAQEVKCLSQLRHPNVVLYIGACTRMPDICVVMEWCAHGSLDELLLKAGAPLATQHVIQYALDIAQGLTYLHAQTPSLIHRDMKSANVFVDSDYTMKVGDFGLALALTEELERETGSPAWMAPETWAGDNYDQMVDVWSFGWVLMEMITRRAPFHQMDSADDIKETLESRTPIEEITNIPAWVPDELRDLILNCLQYKPENRPCFQDIIDTVRQWFDGWKTAQFYQHIDFRRLEHFLTSDDEDLQHVALKEIAVLEADQHAEAISIALLPPEKFEWFLTKLTSFLRSANKDLRMVACEGLCALFARLTKESLEDDSSLDRRFARAVASPRGAMLKVRRPVFLADLRAIVGNHAKGLYALIDVIVRELRLFHLVPDTRLLGVTMEPAPRRYGEAMPTTQFATLQYPAARALGSPGQHNRGFTLGRQFPVRPRRNPHLRLTRRDSYRKMQFRPLLEEPNGGKDKAEHGAEDVLSGETSEGKDRGGGGNGDQHDPGAQGVLSGESESGSGDKGCASSHDENNVDNNLASHNNNNGTDHHNNNTDTNHNHNHNHNHDDHDHDNDNDNHTDKDHDNDNDNDNHTDKDHDDHANHPGPDLDHNSASHGGPETSTNPDHANNRPTHGDHDKLQQTRLNLPLKRTRFGRSPSGHDNTADNCDNSNGNTNTANDNDHNNNNNAGTDTDSKSTPTMSSQVQTDPSGHKPRHRGVVLHLPRADKRSSQSETKSGEVKEVDRSDSTHNRGGSRGARPMTGERNEEEGETENGDREVQADEGDGHWGPKWRVSVTYASQSSSSSSSSSAAAAGKSALPPMLSTLGGRGRTLNLQRTHSRRWHSNSGMERAQTLRNLNKPRKERKQEKVNKDLERELLFGAHTPLQIEALHVLRLLLGEGLDFSSLNAEHLAFLSKLLTFERQELKCQQALASQRMAANEAVTVHIASLSGAAQKSERLVSLITMAQQGRSMQSVGNLLRINTEESPEVQLPKEISDHKDSIAKDTLQSRGLMHAASSMVQVVSKALKTPKSVMSKALKTPKSGQSAAVRGSTPISAKNTTQEWEEDEGDFRSPLRGGLTALRRSSEIGGVSNDKIRGTTVQPREAEQESANPKRVVVKGSFCCIVS